MKTVLITGAGRGIGSACAMAFAERGINLVLCSRTESELRAVEKQILSRFKINILSVPTNVSDEKEVRGLFESATEKFGDVEYLVNNAGVFLGAPFADFSSEAWDQVIAVNLRGPFLLSRELFRLAQRNKKPRAIVNVSSLAGIQGTVKFPGFSAYSASKFGVVGLTEALAPEGRSLGIRVNCICPGAVDTKMLRDAAPDLKTQAKPHDIAGLVAFLCDEEKASAITGSVIPIYTNR